MCEEVTNAVSVILGPNTSAISSEQVWSYLLYERLRCLEQENRDDANMNDSMD